MKPRDKDRLRANLKSLLVSAQGDVKDTAKKVSTALEALIADNTPEHKKEFAAAVKAAMTVPRSPDFKTADQEVKKIFEEVLQLIGRIVQDYIALNEQIKQEKKKKQQKTTEQVAKQRRPGGPS